MAVLGKGWMMGLEPMASRTTIWRSDQLSYTHRVYIDKFNASKRILLKPAFYSVPMGKV